MEPGAAVFWSLITGAAAAFLGMAAVRERNPVRAIVWVVAMILVIVVLFFYVPAESAGKGVQPDRPGPVLQHWFLLEGGKSYVICPTEFEPPTLLAPNAIFLECEY